MSLFGGIGNRSSLATVAPDGRYDAAKKELHEAEASYGVAESRLIKARRAYEEASQEWRNFYYPRQEELEEASREGRAKLIVDNRNETDRLLNAAMDHIAGTLEQPADQRAWDHLLIYCPLDRLEAAYVRKAQRQP